MINKKGLFCILSAPSGTGKTTIAETLKKSLKNLKQSVSYTTRSKRKNEENGVDYFFVSKKDFQKKIENDNFIEWAKVHNHFYGTGLEDSEKILNSGKDILLTIDVQGACQLKKRIKSGIYIFILPPSLNILKTRLKNRNTNTQAEIDERLNDAHLEISRINEFDYIVINKNLEKAIEQIKSIITAEKYKSRRLDDLIKKVKGSDNWNLDL